MAAGEHSDLEMAKGTSWVVLAGVIVLVGVLVAGVHWPALSAGALSFDDDLYVTQNYWVQHPSWASTWQFLREFRKPTTVMGYYHPLTMISLMVDYGLGGRPDDLRVFHRTNLGLHVANTALIVVLMYLLFGQILPAVLVGVLFGVHPMTVEQVAWVNERKTLLAAFFSFWCLTLYVLYGRKGNWKLLVLALAMYFLAVMSKATSTTLPLLLLLLDFWPLRRLSWRSVWEKAPFFGLMVIWSVVTVTSQRASASAAMPSARQLGSVVLSVCHNIVFYLYKIVWPVDLVNYYPNPRPLALSHPMVLAGVIGTCVLVVLLVVSLKWTRAVVTGWLLFFVAIFPILGVISVTIGLANKFVYLPSVGLLILLAWGMGKMMRGRRGTIAVIVVVVVVAGLEVAGARRYVGHWRDTEGLFRYMAAVVPNSAPVRCLLANALAKRGAREEALEHYEAAAQLAPYSSEVWNSLATMLLVEGKPAEAIPYYLKGLRLDPKRWNALCNLGQAYYKTGQQVKAIESWREALRLRPHYPKVEIYLMRVQAPENDPAKALAYYDRIVQEKPNWAEARRALGLALAQSGRVDEAMAQWRAALKLEPTLTDVRFNLGKALEQKGEIAAAAREYEKTLQYDRKVPGVRVRLAAVLSKLGREEEARSVMAEERRLKTRLTERTER